jgi:hypothetical protein
MVLLLGHGERGWGARGVGEGEIEERDEDLDRSIRGVMSVGERARKGSEDLDHSI